MSFTLRATVSQDREVFINPSNETKFRTTTTVESVEIYDSIGAQGTLKLDANFFFHIFVPGITDAALQYPKFHTYNRVIDSSDLRDDNAYFATYPIWVYNATAAKHTIYYVSITTGLPVALSGYTSVDYSDIEDFFTSTTPIVTPQGTTLSQTTYRTYISTRDYDEALYAQTNSLATINTVNAFTRVYETIMNASYSTHESYYTSNKETFTLPR